VNAGIVPDPFEMIATASNQVTATAVYQMPALMTFDAADFKRLTGSQTSRHPMSQPQFGQMPT
jgi:hypothetical protein